MTDASCVPGDSDGQSRNRPRASGVALRAADFCTIWSFATLKGADTEGTNSQSGQETIHRGWGGRKTRVERGCKHVPDRYIVRPLQEMLVTESRGILEQCQRGQCCTVRRI